MYRLLIVDPDVQFRQYLSSAAIWNKIGIQQIVTAQDGQSALRIAKDLRPELVLSEIQLPGLNGLEWIELLSNEDFSYKVAFLSGQDDFNTVRAAMKLKVVDYLLKPVKLEQVESVVKKMIHELEQQIMNWQTWTNVRLLQRDFVQNMIMGNKYYSDQAYRDNLHSLQLGWMDTSFCVVMAVEIDHFKDPVSDWKEQHLIYFAADNVLKELSDLLEHSILLPQGETGWIIVIGLPSEARSNEKETNYTWVQKIGDSWITEVRLNTHARISIGISTLTSHGNELSSSLSEALEALSFKKFVGSNQALRYDQIIAIFTTEGNDKLEINRLQNDPLKSSPRAVLKQAIDYITSNLSLRLKLEDVASHLFISPVWLSRLFRTKMDMTFLQYVTRLKMEEAKVMLKHNRASVQQVASQLGYEDAVYFAKLFKRHVGVSPTEYKRS